MQQGPRGERLSEFKGSQPAVQLPVPPLSTVPQQSVCGRAGDKPSLLLEEMRKEVDTALHRLDESSSATPAKGGDLQDALEALRRLALELKQVNAGLCDTNAQLERVLAERIRETEVLTRAVREGEQRRRSLAQEFDHRVKNALAVMQSLAVESRLHAPTPEDFEQGLRARLAALARSHDLLAAGAWEGAALRDVIVRTLAPYADGNGETSRIVVEGPDIYLTPSVAVTVNLAFHELLSNAVKHGALSVPEGRVEVRWHVDEGQGVTPAVEIDWREQGGPPVRPPERRGFGSRLVERGLQRGLSAEVRLNFAPEGVECLIRLPLGRRVVAAPPQAAAPA